MSAGVEAVAGQLTAVPETAGAATAEAGATPLDRACAYLAKSRTPELAGTIHAHLTRTGAIADGFEVRHLKAAMANDARFARHGKFLWKLAGRDYRPAANRTRRP